MQEAKKSFVFKLMKKSNLSQANGHSDDLILVSTFNMHAFYRILVHLHFNTM